MKVLKFSHLYTKIDELFQGQIITTIRRQLRYHVGEIIKVHLNYSYLCYAKIIDIQKKPLYEISTDLLIKDTAPFAKNRTEAIALLNSFYRKPLRDTEELFVLFLKKTEVVLL